MNRTGTERLRHGGCACGAVRFEARRAPYRVGLCHCLTCRKVHGAPFNAFAVYPVEAVTISGRTGRFRTGATGQRFFCRSCGSPIYSRDTGSDEIELHLGSFDEPNAFAPTFEAFTTRREDWLGALPTLTHHFEGNRPEGARTQP